MPGPGAAGSEVGMPGMADVSSRMTDQLGQSRRMLREQIERLRKQKEDITASIDEAIKRLQDSMASFDQTRSLSDHLPNGLATPQEISAKKASQ